MSQNSTSLSRGPSPAPVWKVWPFTLELRISEREFQEERARIRMKAGFTALKLMADARMEESLWQARTPLETALERDRIADAMRLPASDRGILGLSESQAADGA